MEEKLKDVREIAEYLRLDVQTIYRMVANGEIPHVKAGSAIRFKMSEIESWLKKNSGKGK